MVRWWVLVQHTTSWSMFNIHLNSYWCIHKYYYNNKCFENPSFLLPKKFLNNYCENLALDIYNTIPQIGAEVCSWSTNPTHTWMIYNTSVTGSNSWVRWGQSEECWNDVRCGYGTTICTQHGSGVNQMNYFSSQHLEIKMVSRHRQSGFCTVFVGWWAFKWSPITPLGYV
jgi:hypothetical protein